ncbi:hypothetical protein JG688_00012329 [Phytophthora aleatoria]|uniref:Helitron helicase-like domain-containing protein n=1 Tax=Phytophthora aleatoria TaxID=2496075 RepID=A0A8J5IFF7_9STRA|nr:hypothetical protein JG688_00012329 [Phytophthora aleatoria]
MGAEQQNIRGQSDAWRAICENDEERGTPQVDRVFLVRRSDHILNGISGDIFAKLFSHLFPFVKECVTYYIALSGRQFAEDELFTLVAFDRISLQNMFIHNCVRCKRFPPIYEGYETRGSEQLGNVLLTNERRRQGCLPRTRSTDRTMSSFLKTVEIATGATRFGQPPLFVTLTPNKTLFDVLDARMPTKAELREASIGYDCASACLFMRQVDIFIKYVLGVDPATKKPTPHRGLFGTEQKYFGMV